MGSALSHLLVLLISILLLGGCTPHVKKTKPTVQQIPDITAAYLFEHRIISYRASQQMTTVATLPYEILTFDERYTLHLVAQFSDANSSATANTKKRSNYYLLIQRQSDNWRDFTHVEAKEISNLKIESLDSHIRHGNFFKFYSIDFSKEQLLTLKNSELTLTLSNDHGFQSLLKMPKNYIEAFLQIIDASPLQLKRP